ncbi:endonuclease/exonuclease/phosphatase family protein [Streptomyces boncukensis]|uniref:Endonuclease/exonuclease/phosphatase family protein n=1 Tax=Streptomyces boncukensis TaxID=2711219 RepID=A0A6G4X1N6_9ACTN|nr:endonuclease/exonuclease/phosphatase family protein [Streptomyces boncukensis]NGO71456.1 endonuclease/exonuclease/phosphatase family protein [Streptomyces boncukensis]
MTEHDDDLVLVSWNLEADGEITDTGDAGPAWHLAHDILAEVGPDILLRQEMKYSRTDTMRRLHDAELRLGMSGYLAPDNPGAPDLPSGVFLRPGLFEVNTHHTPSRPWWLRPCHLTVRLGDCPRPLDLISFHMCFYDPATRSAEAQWLTLGAEPGRASLIAGDCNSYPDHTRNAVERVILPDWDTVPDRAHATHRTIYELGCRVSDTRPDRILCDAGYVDLARHACTELEQPSALHPTAGYDKRHQSGPQRIDRAYASAGLHRAVTSVEVIDTDQTRRASDHAMLVVRLSRRELENALTPETSEEYHLAS